MNRVFRQILLISLLVSPVYYLRASPGMAVADTVPRSLVDKNDTAFQRRAAMVQAAAPHHTVYLIDISNSMKEESRLDSLKNGLHYLVQMQREVDRMSVITFRDSAKVILNFVSCSEKDIIMEKIDTLFAKGGTNAQDALLDAYKIVDSTRHFSGKTKLVLITDGMFDIKKNVRKKIEAYDKVGVPTSIILMGSLHDVQTIEFLEQLCEKGKGEFYYMRNYNLYEVLVKEASD